ncbi:NAD-P-binding protein [Lentinula aciculospora]|uniref:NAD-P-binding protein n=1 Tax=Lentinula aciculospora TaxID=153920 RepID=A0A9W9DXR6_9AGAR|nr:NAD-P-binding protein [Lentinula aciculospora]KAJ4490105.1 NAD-P-binding protein [Lentinula aciculospora]
MVKSSSLSEIKSENAKITFPYLPVAVFVGGTSGIGRGIAEAFARYTKGNAHIILVGRNHAAAESIIASFPHPTSLAAKHEFIQCDVTLLKNVRQTTSEILARHYKINFLVLSPGVLTFTKENTEDGIDRSAALMYYSRWKFIYDLAPALTKAREDNEDAKVLSVLSAGNGVKINLDDLELKKASAITRGRSLMSYNDIMMDGFAFHFPSISFIHCYPGWVRTPIGSDSDSLIMRTAYFLSNSPFSPLSYLPMSLEDCGEHQLYGILYTASTPGVWRIGKYGNDIGKQGYYGDDNARDTLWQHTLEATVSK